MARNLLGQSNLAATLASRASVHKIAKNFPINNRSHRTVVRLYHPCLYLSLDTLDGPNIVDA
jgi:hypothetical protein